MRIGVVFCILLFAAAIAELAFPDASFIHATWWILAIAALALLGTIRVLRSLRTVPTRRRTVAALLMLAAMLVVGAAGFSNSLFAPDPRTIVAVPGAQVALPELGATLVFPDLDRPGAHVVLERGGERSPISCRHALYRGATLLRCLERTVVAVSADTLAGAHLTITQPTGSTFLSPVLLMQHTQEIAGFNLPFDSFALPAVHRDVKVVLFTAAQAQLLRGGSAHRTVLFAVDDSLGRTLAHSLGLAANGKRTRVADLFLQPRIHRYPAIVVLAVPSQPILGLAVLLALAALGFWLFGGRPGDPRTQVR